MSFLTISYQKYIFWGGIYTKADIADFPMMCFVPELLDSPKVMSISPDRPDLEKASMYRTRVGYARLSLTAYTPVVALRILVARS